VTYETKYLIDVSDILGVELECKKCKMKIALAIADSTKAIWECPICHEDWIIPGSDQQNAIQSLLRTFQNAVHTLQGRPFSMKLQITAPPKP
jgi:ribosomal protein L37AE/L43A